MQKYLVKITANARANEIKEVGKNVLKVKISAPPIDGQANVELVKMLAKHFGVHRSEVLILKGLASREKIVGIAVDG